MVKPKVQAKSSRVADKSAFGFGNASFGGFATVTSPLSYLTELPDVSKISDPNTAVIFKNLFKRDSVTKVRALEDLQNLLSTSAASPPVVEDAILDIWIAIYPRTSIDSVRRVRLLAHSVQASISAAVGKSLARHMPKLAGPWLLGSYDTDKAVASEAQSSLSQMFSSEKQLALRKAYQPQILELCANIIEKENPKTLSDERVVSHDEATMKYDRVVAGSLGLFGSLLQSLSEADRAKEKQSYTQLLTDKKLWSLISSQDSSVRRAVNQLLRICLDLPEIKSVLDSKSLSSAYVEKGLKSDQNGTALDLINTVCILTKAFPDIWTDSWSGRKSPISRIRELLAAGSRGAASTYWQHVSSLLDMIPKEAYPASGEEVQELLAAYREGVTSKIELKSHLKSGLLGFIEAIPSVTSNLDEQERSKVLSGTAFPILESFVLTGSDTPWTISVESGPQVIQHLLAIDGFIPTSSSKWTELTSSVVEKMKLSLPETSKEYKSSQDGVKETGLRWVLVTKDLLTASASTTQIEQAIIHLLRECIELCQSRKGKPYGATITIQVLLRYLSSFLWMNTETSDLLEKFILQSLPDICVSPSTSSLGSILLAAKDQSFFVESWTACLSTVVAANDSPAKLEAFTTLLNVAKQSGASFMTDNKDIDALIQSQLDKAMQDELQWKPLVSMLSVVSDKKAVETLSIMASKLSLSDEEATSVLDGFSAFGKTEPKLLESYVASTGGSVLLESVLRLIEAPDETLARAASTLNSLLHRPSGGSKEVADRPNRMAEVITSGLNTASVDCVSVHTLIAQASTILRAKQPADQISLLPDIEIWKSQLDAYMASSPAAVTGMTETVPGIVFNIESGNVSQGETTSMTKDAEGLSVPLRMALYTVGFFEVVTLADIDRERATQVVKLLTITTILANDNLSLEGCNNIWLPHDVTTTEDIAEFLSSSQHLISAWLTNSRDWWLEDHQNSPFAPVRQCMEELFQASKGSSALAYYCSKAYEYLATQLTSKHGLSQRQLAETPSTLATLRRSEHLFQVSAFITAHRDFISNFPITKNWYNALIADITGLDVSEQLPKAIQKLSYLNVFLTSMDEDFVTTAAMPRLTILLRDLVAGLEDSTTEPALQALILSALGRLAAPLKSVYGEYWATMLTFIKNLWSETSSLAPDGPQDASLNRLYESQRLYRALARVSRSEDCNEDLSESLVSLSDDLHHGLLNLLALDPDRSDEYNQPLRIVRDFIANALLNSPENLNITPEDLYPVIASRNESVQGCAYELLHIRIPQMQDQISLDAAIEKTTARIPEELMSLILDAPARMKSDVFNTLTNQLNVKRYLYAWALVFDHFNNASHQTRTMYLEDIREGGQLHSLLDLTFDLLGHSRNSPLKAKALDITSFTAGASDTPRQEIEWLLCHLYYRSLVHVSSLTKDWWMQSKRGIAASVQTWTQTYITPLVSAAALNYVNIWSTQQESGSGPDDKPLVIKTNIPGSELTASYTIGGEDDERSLAISVKLPLDFPLHPAEVISRSTSSTFEAMKWRNWLMIAQAAIMLNNNSIPDGLLAWRRNIVGAMQGQSECTICYSLVSEDGKLPSKTCSTCKHAFHMLCLSKWFQSSGDKKCPLCRSDFTGLGRAERGTRRGAIDRD